MATPPERRCLGSLQNIGQEGLDGTVGVLHSGTQKRSLIIWGGGVKLIRLLLLILRACTAWMRSQRPLIRKDAGESAFLSVIC